MVMMLSSLPVSTGTNSTPRIDINYRLICPDCCDPYPKIVIDYSQGDLICESCGIVLGDRIIDTSSEWRSFSNGNQSKEHDPSRTGGPVNSVNDGVSQLETMISRTDKNSNLSRDLARLHTKGMSDFKSRHLTDAFKHIGLLCDRMVVPQLISSTAKQLYKQFYEEKPMRGQVSDGLIAACVYAACRIEHFPRSIKEIMKFANVTKRELSRPFKLLFSTLKLGDRVLTIKSEDFLTRFCSYLDLSGDIQRAVASLTAKVKQLGISAGKSPITIVAAGIYLISQLTDSKRTAKEIADVAGITELTLRSAYKDFYAARREIIPGEFFNVFSSAVECLPIG